MRHDRTEAYLQGGTVSESHLDGGDMQIASVGAAGEPEDDLEAHKVTGHSRAHVCTQCPPGSAQRSMPHGHMSGTMQML